VYKICRKYFHHNLTVLSHYLRKVTLLLLLPFNSLFSRRAWVSQYQKDKTSLDLNEVRDGGVLECSSISWTICKQSAHLAPDRYPHQHPITQFFYRPDALPDAQPTMSKHWRQCSAVRYQWDTIVSEKSNNTRIT